MGSQRRRSVIALIFICCAISSTSSDQVRDLQCFNSCWLVALWYDLGFFDLWNLVIAMFVQVGTNYRDSHEFFDSDTICISDQYIMESYFTTYTSLDDSEFRNFLLLQQCSDKVPTQDSNIVPATSFIQHRNITGEGSHRNLITSIKLLLHHSESQFRELVIVERLPLGVFADPFELQSLQQRRG